MLMIHLNFAEDADHAWDGKDELYVISAFNKLPLEITAENILQRKYRPWLLRVTEELNANSGKVYDVLDVVLRLQQLRKQGRLRNKPPTAESSEEAKEGMIEVPDHVRKDRQQVDEYLDEDGDIIIDAKT